MRFVIILILLQRRIVIAVNNRAVRTNRSNILRLVYVFAALAKRTPLSMPLDSKQTNHQPATLRGLRKCSSCGAINGSRALLCRNPVCPQNKNSLDGVQLICHRTGCAIYSLRIKEFKQQDAQQSRNFVCIEDVTLSLQPNAAVVSSKAICHVDACKSENNNCKHIKACRECSEQMPKATVYSVSREVLWNLNISREQKQQLWQQYKSAEEQEQLPAVQRLNATTFVVRCERSESFPAAHLHVTALANGLSTKKGIYACACRKLKIIVEPDNSLVMQDEICDHILLVLAGILSSPQGKTVYGNFTKSLQSFWMPAKLETPLGEVLMHDDLRLGLSINIGGDMEPPEDIYIFDDEVTNDLLSLPEDLSDVVYNVDAATPTQNSASNNAVVRYANDAQLLSNYDIYAEQHNQHLELTDCNIELMDQYQLTDQIDLCSDDIELPLISEPFNILAPPPAPANQLPAIELPTISVIKETAIKASEIVKEVKTRKQPPLPAKRTLIVNETNTTTVETVGVEVQPALAYEAWLDYVIELINDSIEPVAEQAAVSTRPVQHSLHVHKETFSHFNKSFSAGIKRRPLDNVTVIASGKHKGRSKYEWHFRASHTVKRIFSSRNLSLQLQRSFERQPDGHFEPYVRQAPMPATSKQRQVYTRLRLYMVNMLFDSENPKSGLLLSWTPDVLPRSQFGLLQIEFVLQTNAAT